jgi:hypothetical protein
MTSTLAQKTVHRMEKGTFALHKTLDYILFISVPFRFLRNSPYDAFPFGITTEH